MHALSGRRAAGAMLAVLVACGGAPRREPPGSWTSPTLQRGMATFYADPQMTASGERFDKHQLTAAHRTLPFGTRVRVTNLNNGRTVDVRINDRGPFGHGRVIDLSEAAARKLGMIDAGVVPVTVEVLQ